MGPKDTLAELLYRTGITRRVVQPADNLLIVFGYHRIRPRDEEFRTPFDSGVFGPTVDRLHEQLRWLRKHTRILSEEELIGAVESKEPLPEPCSVVTFDDGYRDNYTLALPVLEQLGVPATFFLPSDLIETRRLGWWDLIAYFVKRSRKSSITLDGRQHALGERRGLAIDYLHRKMRVSPSEETGDLLERLSVACEVPFPGAEEQAAELMSWDEVRGAADRGVAVGSHAHTHRVLSTLDAAAVDHELRSSKRLLEEKLRREIRSLAYPCGGYEDFDEGVQQAAAAAGYRLAFSFNTGVQFGSGMERFDIKRLGASERPGRLAAMTVFPRLFAWAGSGQS